MESHGGLANHHLELAPDDGSTRPSTSIFILPPEIRQLIWEYAIAKKKILQPKGRFDYASGGWVLSFRYRPLQPSLTQVCRETRHFMLRNGDFIFGKGPTEPGMWWNPKVDILLFTHMWDLRFEWNALEGLRGLEKVKNVFIDQDLARWISYHAIYPTDLGDHSEDYREDQPVGFKFYCLDESPYFKFFLFNGIHPENLALVFTRLLPDPHDLDITYNCGPHGEAPDTDDSADVRVNFNFLNDDMDEVKQKLFRLQTLCQESRQRNLTDRYVVGMCDILLFEGATSVIPGPVFRKGASYEETGNYVDITWVTFFSDLENDTF